MSSDVSNVQLAVSSPRCKASIQRTHFTMLGTVAASVARIPTSPEYRVVFDKLIEWLQRQEQQHPGAYKHEHITNLVILDLVETRYLARIWFKDDILSEAETTEQLRRLIQVAKALEHLHRHEIVHGHLYPGNIFINAKGDATITDVSCHMSARAFTSQELRIPLSPSSVYQAPEALDPRQMDLHPSSDVFSFASTVYAVMTGHSPADVSSLQSIQDSIGQISLFGNSHILKPPVTVIPDTIWQVLKRCWSFNPGARPTMRDVIFDLEDIFLYM